VDVRGAYGPPGIDKRVEGQKRRLPWLAEDHGHLNDTIPAGNQTRGLEAKCRHRRVGDNTVHNAC